MGWIIAIIMVIIFLFIIFYNQIVREENSVNNSFSSVDVLLKKRYDLIPNLVEVVKKSASHESEIFTNIADERAKALSTSNNDEAVKIDGAINSLIKNLLALAENYPDLKANTSFIELQKNLLAMEDELSAARRTYNASVTEFNITLESFPTNIVGKIMKKNKKELFNTTDEVKDSIHINL